IDLAHTSTDVSAPFVLACLVGTPLPRVVENGKHLSRIGYPSTPSIRATSASLGMQETCFDCLPHLFAILKVTACKCSRVLVLNSFVTPGTRFSCILGPSLFA
ncbi:unnamed protein product, partial [Scytosiphon promiscuus]